jgi:hypothetical protein
MHAWNPVSIRIATAIVLSCFLGSACTYGIRTSFDRTFDLQSVPAGYEVWLETSQGRQRVGTGPTRFTHTYDANIEQFDANWWWLPGSLLGLVTIAAASLPVNVFLVANSNTDEPSRAQERGLHANFGIIATSLFFFLISAPIVIHQQTQHGRVDLGPPPRLTVEKNGQIYFERELRFADDPRIDLDLPAAHRAARSADGVR